MGKKFFYSFVVQEADLDSFGHLNNAVYLRLFEQARWDIIAKSGYGLQRIKETGQGPTLLETKIKFLKELKERDEIVIETEALNYERKVGKMIQKMLRGDQVCCEAEFIIGLFDVRERKLVLPTPEWLKAVGLEA